MNFANQIMSKDNYTSILSRQIKAGLFQYPSNICNAREKCINGSLLFAAWNVSLECSLVRLYEQTCIALLQ